ncbi:MAG: CBS domain-containing protein [Nitrososphaerota archaeon]|nr:CBS domain-containing protein [Nitrososphaerota archaeon]
MIYVKDIMTRPVRTIDSGSTIADAAREMAKRKIGSLVVVEGDSPVGIVTEGDVSRSVGKGMDMGTLLRSFTKRKLITVGPGERVEVAAKTMSDNNVKKLPVLEEGELIGILTETDIVSSSFSLVTSLKEMVQARYRPPDFEM